MLSAPSSLDAIRASGRLWRPRPATARRPCIVLALVALLVTLLMLALPRPAAAQPMKGEASLDLSGGYGRILLRFPESIETQVRASGNILVIAFRRPVDIPIDRIVSGAADWIGAARRDPDGMAVRIALARKLRVNKIDAGERVYIDLLPQSWTGAPPGPPQDVVEELARRAREAERVAREKSQLDQLRQTPPVRVRVATQPTFTRYIFELGELTGVSTERGTNSLKLSIAASLRLDLTDAKLASPPAVRQLEANTSVSTTSVMFSFAGPVDLRTFREDANYVVDVLPLGKTAQDDAAPAAPAAPAAMRLAGVEAPETVPAKIAPDANRPAPPAAAPVQPAAAAPPVTPVRAAAATAMPGVGDAPMPPGVPDQPPPAVTPAVARQEPAAPAAGEAPEPAEAAIAAPKQETAPSAPATPPVAAVPARPAAPASAKDAVAATLRARGDAVTISLPFRTPTPAAVFVRGDTLWMVFDAAQRLDVSALQNDPSGTVRSASTSREGDAQVIRVKLERPRVASLAQERVGWAVTIADTATEPSQPIAVSRHPVGPSRTGASVAFDNPRKIHWLRDPDVGDTLLVVTGLGPARGFPQAQTFVEFSALMSTHGIVVQRFADDLTAEIAGDKVQIGRPRGLTLSEFTQPGRRIDGRAMTFDTQLWGFDKQADFANRQLHLTGAAADAPSDKRNGPRIDLARFYLARDLFAEAKAVLDTAITDDKPTADNPTPLVLRAVANIMLGRTELAVKDLANPLVASQDEAQLWRAVALARQGKWTQAREAFRKGEAAMSALPVELQRLVLKDNLRSAIETGDFATGALKLAEFDTIGVPRDLQPSISVLAGRVHEGLGRKPEALSSYRLASESWDRPSATQGKLRELTLRYAMGNLPKAEAISDLEVITTTWRGDETEVEALQILGRLYTEESRYRDAFHVMRTALTAHPNSDLTRRIQDGAAVTFDSLFLAGKGDTLPAIDALALFYDFRELMPIGRRGDEMIRRLADRLVSVDLLDQASELLQHQVDHRLQGAARAQVATRLAVVYLLARKPDRAQAALRATRTSNLSASVRKQRILIESRALSDIGRHDVALETIESIDGPEAQRLRADIQWAAQRWREAAEQIELLYGMRWKEFPPLSDAERADVLRAAVGFALAADEIGISRLREKYEAKMADSPDQKAFAIVTGGLGSDSAEFRDVARTIAKLDTLEAFLRDMRTGYPDTNTATPAASPLPQASLVAVSDTTASIPLPRPRRQPPPRIQLR